MRRIKYIAYYDRQDSLVKRNYVLSATNKIDYIISSLNDNDIAVDIVSLSGCISEKPKLDRGLIKNSGINTLKLFTSFGPTNIGIVRFLSRQFQIIQFVFWFLLNVERGEKLLIYHSLGYCRVLTFLKRIKKCHYVGEIEEIYQDVSSIKKSLRSAEYSFIDVCDSYIFPTHFLNEKLNIYNKPYLIIHGIYQEEYHRNVSWDDNNIHVIYAGTFDANKGGALSSIESVEFLPEGYHMHICGFGTASEIDFIKSKIEHIKATTNAEISYDGLLKGEDFICMLQKCHIGLSTQNLNATFNDTSFPSKVLTYLSNRLNVVSAKIPVVEQSCVGEWVSYYSKQTPKSIADAIINCKLYSPGQISRVLGDLDEKFKVDIVVFLES